MGGKGVLLVGVGLVLLQGAWAFLCYSYDPEDDTSGVVWCPSNSCFSRGLTILGNIIEEKGCADSKYSEGCPADLDVMTLAGGHYCYCNSFLCNSSSLPAVLVPLVLLAFLLHMAL